MEKSKNVADSISAACVKSEFVYQQLANLCALFLLFCETYIDDLPPKESPDYVKTIFKNRNCVAAAIAQLLQEAAESAEDLTEILLHIKYTEAADK